MSTSEFFLAFDTPEDKFYPGKDVKTALSSLIYRQGRIQTLELPFLS